MEKKRNKMTPKIRYVCCDPEGHNESLVSFYFRWGYSPIDRDTLSFRAAPLHERNEPTLGGFNGCLGSSAQADDKHKTQVIGLLFVRMGDPILTLLLGFYAFLTSGGR